jgi:acetyltransferase-like isoleucine patch superfamily enzyme
MLPFSIVSLATIATIYGLPAAILAVAFAALPPGPWALVAAAGLVPIAYPALFVVTAAAISRPHQRAIIPGKFPRDVTHRIYRSRRIYGLCWTCVYYNKPLYFVLLSIPWLRWVTFRGFGYRGQMDFTIYPDTWIRDLPLLEFGKGAYLANRATLGTNMALSNGTSLVGRISVGEGGTVGHLGILAPGTTIGAGAEVGAGTVVGIQCRVGERANLQPCALINHAAQIGAHATVGTGAYIGAAAVVDAGSHVPPFAQVRNRSRFPIPSIDLLHPEPASNHG